MRITNLSNLNVPKTALPKKTSKPAAKFDPGKEPESGVERYSIGYMQEWKGLLPEGGTGVLMGAAAELKRKSKEAPLVGISATEADQLSKFILASVVDRMDLHDCSKHLESLLLEAMGHIHTLTTSSNPESINAARTWLTNIQQENQ